MKNLKKVLALALAFAMSLTLFAGAAFTDDASIGINYKDDVNMLVQLGVVGGYEDNSFKPQGTITRAETTKLIYVLNYGYDDAGELFAGAASAFSDVAANANWAKGYINYCYNQGIVGGVGNGKFNPNGKVTVAELAKMLLVSLGADATKEGYGGSNWAANVVADAMELGVFDGWSGDPTEPASRELACKLMRNTIFAPTYQYSAITGIGSQINAMKGDVKNETLGEKKMGLKHVEGLVVSNARYVLDIDGEGLAVVNNGSTLGNQKDRSQIYYEIENAKESQHNGEMALLDIKIDLPDEMMGNVVDVYFKGESAGDGTYSKVELLGDVLVNSKTVAYNVMSSDIEIMPNGESLSSKEMKPYISFNTEDGEKRVEGRTDYYQGREADNRDNNSTRVGANVDYDGAIFAYRMFFSNATPVGGGIDGNFISPVIDANGVLQREDPAVSGDEAIYAGTEELDLMGTRYSSGKLIAENELARYRFISVDGGETYSYILRLSNMVYAKVSSVNDSTISLDRGIGVRSIGDEAVVLGEVSKNMHVVAYAQDGKVYVEPTVTLTGKATNLKNNSATINGGVYYAAHGIFQPEGAQLGTEIDAYFSDTTYASRNNDSATYVTYGSYILELDSAAVVAAASEYAVILYSNFDTATGVVTVKVAFGDNTVGTYEVSRIGGTDSENENYKNFFANNQQMGALIQAKKPTDGRISLTANDKDIWQQKAGSGAERIHEQAIVSSGVVTPSKTDARAYVEGGMFYFAGKGYHDSGNSVIFMIYGGAPMSTGDYTAINAKAYKLSNIGDASGNPDAVWVKIGNEAAAATSFQPFYIGDIVKTTNGLPTVVAGVMSVGEHASAGNADPDNTAYIISAEYGYNPDTTKWFLDVDMITKDGIVSTRSIDEANNGSSTWIPQNGERVGDPAIAPGSLAVFEMGPAEDGSEDQWIVSLETGATTANSNVNGDVLAMCAAGSNLTPNSTIVDGYYAVQIGVANDEQISFFPSTHIQNANITDKQTWSDNIITAEINKYKFDVIAIDDNRPIEEGEISTINYSDVIDITNADGVANTADDYAYNAIIVVEDEEIVRVFSLYNNI